jgi:hypothetical protein
VYGLGKTIEEAKKSILKAMRLYIGYCQKARKQVPVPRTVLVVVLSATLLGIPATATTANPTSAPLGVILQAGRARAGADITSGGAAIYEGDRL